MEKEKRLKKLNNGGFSLVELIIVVAIMAILIGVLAPQYLQYVERSRRSTDMQNVASIISAIQIYSADPNVAAANRIPDNATVTLSAAAATPPAFSTGSHIDDAFNQAGISTTDIRLRSNTWTSAAGAGTVVLTVDVNATTGAVTVTADPVAIAQ